MTSCKTQYFYLSVNGGKTVTFSIEQKACIRSIYIAANKEMCLIESVNPSVESVYEGADHRGREDVKSDMKAVRNCIFA